MSVPRCADRRMWALDKRLPGSGTSSALRLEYRDAVNRRRRRYRPETRIRGRTLARLGDEETIWAAADVLRRWIELYGVPLALYTDWKNAYVREPNAEDQVTGAMPLTQFGRMCASLGIQIAASSPQAKGPFPGGLHTFENDRRRLGHHEHRRSSPTRATLHVRVGSRKAARVVGLRRAK
jgi:hypothetical protein